MTTAPERELRGYWLGRRRYAPTHALMQALKDARQAGVVADTLLLLEHEPVITLGRGAHSENILAGREELARIGVEVADTGRGGDVTLHAPGQLVAYPIVDLSPDRQDVRKYVHALTTVMQRLIAPAGLAGGTVDALIGLWLDAQSPGRWPGQEAAIEPVKIGAIGVRISRWVTTHGFALNLKTDLSLFRLIVPCGISQHGVTSVASLTGAAPEPASLASSAHELLAQEFGRRPSELEDLSALPDSALAKALGLDD